MSFHPEQLVSTLTVESESKVRTEKRNRGTSVRVLTVMARKRDLIILKGTICRSSDLIKRVFIPLEVFSLLPLGGEN